VSQEVHWGTGEEKREPRLFTGLRLIWVRIGGLIMWEKKGEVRDPLKSGGGGLPDNLSVLAGGKFRSDLGVRGRETSRQVTCKMSEALWESAWGCKVRPRRVSLVGPVRWEEGSRLVTRRCTKEKGLGNAGERGGRKNMGPGRIRPGRG